MKKINILVYLVMQKGNPKNKIEVRSFSGYTLKNRYRKEHKRDILVNALVDQSNSVIREYRWFSVVPKDRNLIFHLAEQIGPRLGNFIGGVLNAMSRPFNILVRVLFSNRMVWTGSPNFFWKTTISVVGLVYKQAYLALTKKGKLTSAQADPIARAAARIFCNFMLTTRLGYQLSLYQYGIEEPERGEEAPLSETEARAIAGLDEEVTRELEGTDTSIGMNIQKVTRQLINAFRRLRLNQIFDRLEPASYQRIAYAFIVNSQGDVSIRWTLYAKGTHAYTTIISALTDMIVDQVKEVGGIGVPMAGEVAVAARRKLRSRSFSDEMGYEEDMEDYIEKEEYLGRKHTKKDEDEMEELYRDYDYMYDETYQDEYVDEEEYTDDEAEEVELGGEYDDYGEEYEDYGDEYDDEYDENEYEYEEADEGIEDLIVTDLEPETSDYELPEYSESTQMEPVYDEDEGDEQLVETLKSIEPSLSAFRLADKFLRTRSFSNSLSLKRKFYDFLVSEFVNTRAFNKKEEKEMAEAAAEIVGKLDAVAEDVKDIRTMLAKAIEAMDVATADEGSEETEESDDSGSSWDDFWRSDSSDEEEGEGGEEDEGETDEASDEAESDEESEDEKGYRSYYARLRKYKKRKMRMPKNAAKPTKKPKAKGI